MTKPMYRDQDGVWRPDPSTPHHATVEGMMGYLGYAQGEPLDKPIKVEKSWGPDATLGDDRKPEGCE